MEDSMKKIILKIFLLVSLFGLIVTPAIALAGPNQVKPQEKPDWERPQRPEPELLPQEILDEFEGGMTIEEFLIRNQGPIPNALLEFADIPVVVVVQLEKPSLIEYVNEKKLNTQDRADQVSQVNYIEELESDQVAILGQITANRDANVTQIGDSFTKTLNGFMLQVPAKMVNEIRALSGVKSVTRAPEYVVNLGASVPLIGADEIWDDLDVTGKGITIAVIDTGIDYTHAMFGGSGDSDDYANNDPDTIEPGSFPTAKVIGGYDFAGSDYDASGEDGDPYPTPDDDPLDEYGHGTHVAGIAAGYDIGFGAGVAPDAKLYALKIFGREGSTNLTLHAIEWAMDPKGLGHLAEPVDVINMSLGANWGPADENDPEYLAVENATSIGVVVAASAGNAGDQSYIVGSPSVSDSAISVASSTTGLQTLPYLTYFDNADEKIIPYTTSYNAFESTITADLVDVTDFDPTSELCTISGLVGDELEGKIALISRGTCSFFEKINNAEDLGAVAAIIRNNQAGTIAMDTTGSTLPAGSILQSDGLLLKSLAPIEISIGPDARVSTFPGEGPDTISSFSSRGPRGFDSKLKPEITAPGTSIFSADMGSGDKGVSMNGTSMAAPHIAGVAALLAEGRPEWDPVHIKAAMMNTAMPDIGGANFDVPRIGAGRVNAFAAISTDVVAYADPKLVSLTWGVIEVFDTFEDDQTITLENFGDTDVTLDVDVYFTSYYDDTDGATLTPATNTVTIPAYDVISLEMTLELIGEDLPIEFGELEEFYGYVVFSNELTELVLPFYFVPRPYTVITELEARTTFDLDEFGWVILETEGPVESDLWAYPVSIVSPRNPDVLPAADLRYVGMDYGGTSSYGDMFIPVFAMWGDVHNNQPHFNEIDLYIDSPYGSVVNFNYNYGALSGAGQDNTWVVVQVDLITGDVDLGSPYTIYADFNSGVQEWYLPAGWQFVLDEFEYEVVSFDYNGEMDYGGFASFDISKYQLYWDFDSSSPQNEEFDFWFAVPDWDAYDAAGIQGIMLVDYAGKPGVGQAYFWPLSFFKYSHYFPIFGR